MDLRISQIAELTGLSMRYWQRKAMAGELEISRLCGKDWKRFLK